MWAIASCVLLAVSALGARHVPYSGSHTFKTPQNYAPTGAVYPIDYNDELTITNPGVKPDSNIFFSFEQVRRDQPPIVDAREESIGKYMYRRHKTTTTITSTTVAPTTVAPTESYSQEEMNYESPLRHRFHIHNVQPVMLATGTTEGPKVPSFHDFSIDGPLPVPDSRRINARARYPDVNKWSQPQKETPPPATTPKWEEFDDLEAQPHTSSSGYSWDQHQPRTNAVTTIVQVPSTTQVNQREHNHGHRSRGSHRFMSDVVQPAMPPIVPTVLEPVSTTVSPKRPPPPVPTLSPWEGDSFGK